MTIGQLYVFSALYLVLLVVVAFFTRATTRRIVGAITGAAVGAPTGLGIIAYAEHAGWWCFPVPWDPYSLTLMCLALMLNGFVFLPAWRIVRRGSAVGTSPCG